MMHLTNHIKSIVQSMLARQGQPRWGIVTSVNPAIPVAKVMLQPDGVETGWLPIKCIAAGPVHVIALPSPGDQVQVHADCGDAEHGVIAMAAHGGSVAPPSSPVTNKPPQCGEFGIFIGPLYMHMANGNIYMGGGNLVLNGAMTATGNVTAGFGTGDQVDVLGHTHGYLPGSGGMTQTNAPTPGT